MDKTDKDFQIVEPLIKDSKETVDLPSESDSFVVVSQNEPESPFTEDSFIVMDLKSKEKSKIVDDEKEDKISTQIIKVNKSQKKPKPKKVNPNKINLTNYDYTNYKQKVIKDKRQRVGFIKKNKKYISMISEYQKEPYYNKEEDRLDMEDYYKDITPLRKITYDDLNTLLYKTRKIHKNRKDLFNVIDRRPNGTIRCVYSNKYLEDHSGMPFGRDYNEEHVVPQCFYKNTNCGAAKDLHQIFICDKEVNLCRGKKALGIIEETDFLKIAKCGRVFKNGKVKTFEPFNSVGAVSRAVLYILVCYKGVMDRKKFPLELLSYIINKAVNEPVSIWERHRNAEIFKRQGNRNPFIDFPRWSLFINFAENSFN